MNKQWSRYNFLELSERHKCAFLYNTMSNSLLKIEETEYPYMLKLKNGEIKQSDLDPSTSELLIKNSFLVEDDNLEFLKFKFIKQSNRFDKSRMALTITPTIQCNLACSYCFEKEHSDIFMTPEVENDIITFIKKHKEVKYLHITWYGGEPLLAFDSIKNLTNKIKTLNLDKFTADIITNGINLKKEVIEELENLNINRVHITLDGLEETHNNRRPMKDGGNSFQTILNNLDLLFNKSNINKTIRVNVDNTNSSEFPKLHSFLRNRYKGKPMNVYVGFVKNSYGSCTSTDEITMNDKKQANYIVDLNKNHNIFSSYFLSPNRYNNECIARKVNGYLIDAQGYLYKCWVDVSNKSESIGHINQLKELNLNKNIKYLAGEDAFDDRICQKCSYLPICGGGCPHIRLKEKIKTCHIIKNNILPFIEEYYEKYIEKK